MAKLGSVIGSRRARAIVVVLALLGTLAAGPARAAAGDVTFDGVLRTSHGAVVPGADLHLRGPEDFDFTTDDSGAFSVAVVPGDYTLEANAPCCGTPAIPNFRMLGVPITITTDRHDDLTVPVVTVSFTVTGPTGAPFEGATVGLEGSAYGADNFPLYAGGSGRAGCTTDCVGVYGHEDLGGTTDASGTASFDLLASSLPNVNLIVQPPDGATALTAVHFSDQTLTHDTAYPVAFESSDVTAPEIHAVIDATPNAAGWVNRVMPQVSFDCTDAESGIARCPYPVGIFTEGPDQTVTGTAFDRAWNQASTTQTFNVDWTAPQFNAYAYGTHGDNGWYRSDVNVEFVCFDRVSGMASCPASTTLSSDGANQTVTGTALDVAGNSATASITASIDTHPPTITASVRPSPNAAGWINRPGSVHFTCTDAVSGVASCPADQQVSREGRNQVFTGSARDNAGNSVTTSVTVSLDAMTPRLSRSFTSTGYQSAAGWWNAPVTVSWDCLDDLSGVASCTGPTTLGAGYAQSVSGFARDFADNLAYAYVDRVNVDPTPAATSFTTPDGAVIADLPLVPTAKAITGLASDDLSGVGAVEVVLTKLTPGPGLPSQTYWATVSCSLPTQCTWSFPRPSGLSPARYAVTATAIDLADNRDPHPPTITVTFL
ncbi:MAG: hypothetical protein QOG03_1595 [Actinomycetota bacterium]|jgi:hypothetical protein|nr:hypothetical protein [Actinomycetota bacterium]